MITCNSVQAIEALDAQNVISLKLAFDEGFDVGLLGRFKQSLRILDIKVRGFSVLSDDIEALQNLESLSIEGCQDLRYVSPKLGLLTKLKGIRITQCNLKQLPDFEGDFEALTHLELQNNLLMGLPKSLGRARLLRFINLDKNKFMSGPDVLADMPALHEIRLCENWQLTEFFSDLGGRNPVWRELHLNKTGLKTLPNSVFFLYSLSYLYIMNTSIDWVDWFYNLPSLDLVDRYKSLRNIYLVASSSGRRMYFTYQAEGERREVMADMPTQSRAFSENSIAVLEEAIRVAIPAAERYAFMQFYWAPKRNAAWLTRDKLYYLAQTNVNPELNKAAQGWLQAQSKPLLAGQKVALLGDVQTDKDSALRRATELGLIASEQISADTDMAVVGVGISADAAQQLRQRPDLQLVSIQTLRDFFDLHHDFYLKKEEAQEPQQLDSLRALLNSSDIESIDLLLTLLEEGGLPKPMLTEFWANMNLLYLRGHVEQYHRAKNILHQSAPQGWEKALFPMTYHVTAVIWERLQRHWHWLDKAVLFEFFERHGILYTHRYWANLLRPQLLDEMDAFIKRHGGIHIDHLPSAEWLKFIPDTPLLDMSNTRLNRLPAQLFTMKNLKALNLSNSQITTIPIDFQRLKSLEFLNISNNTIRTLPPFLNEMPNLKTIICKNTTFALLAHSVHAKGKKVKSIDLDIWETSDFGELRRH